MKQLTYMKLKLYDLIAMALANMLARTLEVIADCIDFVTVSRLREIVVISVGLIAVVALLRYEKVHLPHFAAMLLASRNDSTPTSTPSPVPYDTDVRQDTDTR